MGKAAISEERRARQGGPATARSAETRVSRSPANRGFVKRLLRRIARKTELGRPFISVHTTLEPGEKLQAGNCSVENVEGAIIVGMGKDLAFLIRGTGLKPVATEGQAFHVKCYSDAERIPEKVASRPKLKAESSKLKPNPPFDSAHGPEPVEGQSEIHNPQSSLPLCIFGPGGDFVRGYTPGSPGRRRGKPGDRNSELRTSNSELGHHG